MDFFELKKVPYETVISEIANEISRDAESSEKVFEALQQLLPDDIDNPEYINVAQNEPLGFFVSNKYYISIKRSTLHLVVFLLDVVALRGTASMIAGMTDSLKKCIWKIKPQWWCLLTEIFLQESPTVESVKEVYLHEKECFNCTETMICPYFSGGGCILKSITEIDDLLAHIENEDIIQIIDNRINIHK